MEFQVLILVRLLVKQGLPFEIGGSQIVQVKQGLFLFGQFVLDLLADGAANPIRYRMLETEKRFNSMPTLLPENRASFLFSKSSKSNPYRQSTSLDKTNGVQVDSLSLSPNLEKGEFTFCFHKPDGAGNLFLPYASSRHFVFRHAAKHRHLPPRPLRPSRHSSLSIW